MVTVDTQPALAYRARGLSRIYRSGETQVHALRSVDVDIPRGELIVLLGPSGSGKSTFLNMFGALDQPTSGTLEFFGQETNDSLRLDAADESTLTEFRRQHVGFIFQFYNLIPSLTALENVRLVTDIVKNPMPAEAALALVGLEERMHHFPSQLSGGEQQRVAVARAIAKRPAVLLCDEPTGALDSKTGVRVLECLADVNLKLGTTTLVITHNAGIADMADRVLHFADGRIVREQTNATRRKAAELSW